MKKTICWMSVVLTLLSSASAADGKRGHRNNRDSTTYREGSPIRHSDYDPTKLPAANRASNKELTQIERQINRTPTVKPPKTAPPKFSMGPQKGPRAERNVPMNFQYKGSKQTSAPTRSRGNSSGRRAH